MDEKEALGESTSGKTQEKRQADLLREQEIANKRLQMILKTQTAIDSITELEDMLERILIEGLNTVDTTRGSLMLIEGNRLVTKAQFGPEMDDPGHTPMEFRVGEGIAGIVAETRQAILCPDIEHEPRFKQSQEGRGIRFHSLLTVPIISHEGNKVLGVISADDPEVNHFDQTHKQLLSDMAVQFATAIEKMLLVDSLRSLHEIFERITSVAIAGRELQPVLDEIARNAIDVLRIDVITIYQYSQGQNKIVYPPLMKGVISQNQHMQTRVFEGEAPWVLLHEQRRHYYASDAVNDRIMNPQRAHGPGFVVREGIKSSAGLLLKVGNEVVGIMFVNYRSPQLFLAREKQIIETFANSAAIAIQDARQWENNKQAQDQLIQAEKMSAVGTLASRVAHELKNPLANILSSINLLEMGIFSPEEVPAKLLEMKSEVHRARDIVDGLLGLARPRDGARGPVNIIDLLDESLVSLENQARFNHIEIDRQLSPAPMIQGNAGMLKRAFGNILKNAIEAMPGGGRLTVSTDDDKTRVSITIRDTGQGIAPENQQRIFEPYFTTKEASGGTGLGLVDSYQIIHDDHRGDIRVDSRGEGEGSTFIVILPIEE